MQCMAFACASHQDGTCQSVVASALIGLHWLAAGDAVLLVMEPHNPADKDAVVIISMDRRLHGDDRILGYVPREHAKNFYQAVRFGRIHSVGRASQIGDFGMWVSCSLQHFQPYVACRLIIPVACVEVSLLPPHTPQGGAHVHSSWFTTPLKSRAELLLHSTPSALDYHPCGGLQVKVQLHVRSITADVLPASLLESLDLQQQLPPRVWKALEARVKQRACQR
jgi:HIRAN domain